MQELTVPFLISLTFVGASLVGLTKLASTTIAHFSNLTDYVASCIPRRDSGSSQEPPAPSPSPPPSPSPSPSPSPTPRRLSR